MMKTAVLMTLLGFCLCVETRAQDAPGGTPSPAEPQPGSDTPTTDGAPPSEVSGDPTQPTPALTVSSAPALTLTEAIAFALANDFGILASADSVSGARFDEAVALAEFYPKVTPQIQRSPDDTSVVVDMSQQIPWTGGDLTAGFATRHAHQDGVPRSSDLSLTLTQPLLRGLGPNASLFNLRNARRSRQGQERAYVLARQALIVRVTEAFFQVIKQRQLLEVARQSAKRTEALRQASEARMQVGLVSKLDVFRAEIQAAQAAESRVAAETGLETALESFRILLGRGPADPVEPAITALSDDVDEPIEPTEILVERAFERRVDLEESRDRVADARRSLALARQNLLPQVDLSLSLEQTGFGQTLGESLSGAGVDRRVGLTVTTGYPLERASDRARRAASELALRAAQRSQREKEFQIETDVRAAVRALERLRKSVELQRQQLSLAEQQHRLAMLRYQRGLASNFDVVEAEGNLVQARTALVGLLTDFAVAGAQLKRAIGTLDAPPEGSR